MPFTDCASVIDWPGMAWKLLRRLFAAGYYEYDISAYSGRLTEAGRQAAKRIDAL